MRFVTSRIACGPVPDDPQELRDAGITHILDVSDGPGPLTDQRHGFVSMWFPPIVGPEEDIIPRAYWFACFAFIDAADRVLVHCTTGTNRAPTLVYGYLSGDCDIDERDIAHYREQALAARAEWRA